MRLKQGGLALGIVVAVLWGAAWFFLSGANTKLHDWAIGETLDTTAKAGFKIERILVEGRVNADKETLLALLNVREGDPIFSLEPQQAKELIERLSWIKSARVERRLPGTIYIGLIERDPLALLRKADKSLVLIDEEGEELTNKNLKRFEDFLMVSGEGAPQSAKELIALLEAEPDLKTRTDSAMRIENRRWDLKLTSGAIVKLPEKDIGLALRTLAARQQSEGLLDKNLKMIDLRDSRRIVVQTALGKAMDLQADAGLPL